MQSSNWIHSRLNECDGSLYIVPEMSGERMMIQSNHEPTSYLLTGALTL